MSVKTEVLLSNSWKVRVSDPGHEGSLSHYFETISTLLEAHIDGEKVRYEFTRKVEGEVKEHYIFAEVSDMFDFLGQSLTPANLGALGIKIGQLGLA